MPQTNQNPPPCEFELDQFLIQLDLLIRSDIKLIDGTVAKIVRLFEKCYCQDEMESIHLALSEALANAIIHGNHSDPKKTVRICVGLQPDCGVLIVVKDTGWGFDPSQLLNPTIGQRLFAEHGRGIFLVKELMQDVKFSFERGTALQMRRRSSKRLEL